MTPKEFQSPEPEFSYVGDELDLFSQAIVWKGYWSAFLRPYLAKRVLEVGAGLGTNTALLADASFASWTCLEPDAALVARLSEAMQRIPSKPAQFHVVNGMLPDAAPSAPFDTILYIDVLEHIEHDQAEVEAAYRLLAPGGHLVVLSPAHQFLYTEFDRTIGHFRRYSRKTLREAGPAGVSPVRLVYLDSVGFFASLANRALLKQSMPHAGQIRFWDRVLVRASKWIDPLLGHSFGKTVIAVWKKS